MALNTRQTLEAAIRDWLNREDQSIINRTPDFITLAETRIFKRLRCKSNEVLQTFNNVTIPQIPIPADLAEVKLLIFDDSLLRYRSDQRYAARSNTEISGTASYFTRLGDQYIIWPWPDGGDARADLYYYQRQALGTQPKQTTQVLIDSPGLYLFGALLEAAPYLKFPENVPLWQAKYDQTLDELMDDTWESEFAGSTNSVQNTYSDAKVTGSDFAQGFGI